MPKHAKKKANKDKARKQKGDIQKRDLPIADSEQLYARIEKACGDRRFLCVCSDGRERIGKLRGKIRKRKKSWLAAGSWVIVAVRDFQDSKVDIITILNPDEVKKLEIYGELSTSLNKAMGEEEDDCVEFVDEVEFNIDEI